MYTQKRYQRSTLIGVILVENFNADNIKNVIIKRGIKQIPKLKFKLVKKFFSLFWKEVPLEEAIERVNIIEKPFDNEQEFIEYACKQNSKIIVYFNELPYSIEIVSYKENYRQLIKAGF